MKRRANTEKELEMKNYDLLRIGGLRWGRLKKICKIVCVVGIPATAIAFGARVWGTVALVVLWAAMYLTLSALIDFFKKRGEGKYTRRMIAESRKFFSEADSAPPNGAAAGPTHLEIVLGQPKKKGRPYVM